MKIWIKYRKWLLISGSFIWILLLDTNNLVNLFKNKSELSNLREKKAYYLTEIDRMKQDKSIIFNDLESVERYAREKYLMKKDNEDIYIIKRKD